MTETERVDGREIAEPEEEGSDDRLSEDAREHIAEAVSEATEDSTES